MIELAARLARLLPLRAMRVNFHVDMLPMSRYLPVDEQPKAAVPGSESIQPCALNIHRPIGIVR